MNPSRLRSLSAFLLSAIVLHAEEITCSHCQLKPPQAGPGSGVRRYAPDCSADLLHLALDVTPDFNSRSVSGKATLTFKPVGSPLEELSLDGMDFEVTSVESTAKLKGHQATHDKVILTFEKPLAVDAEQTVTITYRATPKDGFYFRTPDQGYRKDEVHLFTQGETILARHWFPVLDSPNGKLTTEVTCRLPDGMKAWSNGSLLSQEKDAATGLTAWHWKQEKPHSAYLVTLVAGQFSVIEDRYKDLPIGFLVPQGDAAMAQRSLDGTKEMLAFFEKELDFPFPWEKYHQVVVRDFQWGGMENTSLSTLSDRILHTAEYETLRSSTSIVAHELAHQWFGDVVTCKDWSTLWLNEGFATYYDALFHEQLNGREQFLYDRWRVAERLTEEQNPRPIVFRKINADGYDQFGALSYQKGSWVLHMLRSELGPDLYRKVVQTYLKRYQFKNVVTENFIAVLEEVTGRSWDRFADQWLYHGGHPELKAVYAWDEKSGMARINLKQVQKVSDEVLQFQLPVKVRFKGAFGTVDKVLTLEEAEQDFFVALPSAPKIIRIDPDVELLASIEFVPTRDKLIAQLEDATDSMGRLLAIRQLGADPGADGVERISKVLNNDPQWFVRAEAAKALEQIGTEPAFAALRQSVDQKEARARKAVVESIGGDLGDVGLDTLLKQLETEKNPEIRHSIVEALSAHPEKSAKAKLIEMLDSKSLRNHLFDAAVNAMRLSDDASYAGPLFEATRKRQDELESRSVGKALAATAYLSRNQTDKNELFDHLVKQLENLRTPIADGAATGLGDLADLRARAILTPLANRDNEAARNALKTLAEGVKPAAALVGLQDELSKLQKSNKDLKDELESLKKRIEVIAERPGAKPGGKSKD